MVELAALEKRYGASHRGFESLSLRQFKFTTFAVVYLNWTSRGPVRECASTYCFRSLPIRGWIGLTPGRPRLFAVTTVPHTFAGFIDAKRVLAFVGFYGVVAPVSTSLCRLFGFGLRPDELSSAGMIPFPLLAKRQVIHLTRNPFAGHQVQKRVK